MPVDISDTTANSAAGTSTPRHIFFGLITQLSYKNGKYYSIVGSYDPWNYYNRYDLSYIASAYWYAVFSNSSLCQDHGMGIIPIKVQTSTSL